LDERAGKKLKVLTDLFSLTNATFFVTSSLAYPAETVRCKDTTITPANTVYARRV